MYAYQRLEAWKRAHSGLMMTLKATDDAYHPRSRALFDQLKRAAISVEANIAEGYALGTVPLYKRHIRIALGSAAEAECLVRVAREAGYLPLPVVRDLETTFGKTLATLSGLFKSLHPPRSSSAYSPPLI
jgi:four helix bundle protein